MSDNEKIFTMKLIPIVQMNCSTCVSPIEKELLKLNGVKEARVNYMTKTVKVIYYSDFVGLIDIEAAIERVGYQIAYKQYPSVASKLKDLFRKAKPSTVKAISDADFASKVLHVSKPVAVLFSSPTCPTCKVTKSVYTQVADELAGQAEFYEMDISTSNTCHDYDVLSTPSILIFRDGQLKDRLLAPQKTEIIKALTK
ncbi:MAG: thioredoxin domain-containing protein [Candidatus Bathyarchaeia archaeon]|jgi:thioredoxin 1